MKAKEVSKINKMLKETFNRCQHIWMPYKFKFKYEYYTLGAYHSGEPSRYLNSKQLEMVICKKCLEIERV